MYLDNKTVFLAGSTGLVGSSLIKYITENCPTTTIRAAYYHTKPFLEHERVKYIGGDLRSAPDCRKVVEGCDCAIMAAANTAGSGALSSRPSEQVNNNLIMNARMLEAFHDEGIKRVVFIGSASIYQDFEGFITESGLDLNQDPHPSYLGVGWVMRYLEKLCRFWYKQSGMEFVIARAANVYGPYAKFDPATSNFIPAIIRKAVDRMDPFEVWGSAGVTRDVIYSEDFAKAIVMMMNNCDISFDIFNIGSGKKTTVGDVVDRALEYAGHRPSEIVYNSDKPATVGFRALDCSHAYNTLNWQPLQTIAEGIKLTTGWWIENNNWWKK